MLSMGSTFNTNPMTLLQAGVMGQSAMPMNASITTQTTSMFPGAMSAGFATGVSTGFTGNMQAASTGMPQFSLPVAPSQGGGLGNMAAQMESTGSMMLQCAAMIKSMLGGGGTQAYNPAATCPYPPQTGYPQQPMPMPYTPPVAYNPPPVSYAPSPAPMSPMPYAPQQPAPYMPLVSSLPPQLLNPLGSIPQIGSVPPQLMNPLGSVPSSLAPLDSSQSPGVAPPYVYNPATPEIPPYIVDPNYSSYEDSAPEVPEDPTANYEAPTYNGGDGSKYYGDPHLVGFDGEKYDVMGQPGKIYNMLSDKNVAYNTKFEKWGNDGATVIGETGIQVGEDQIHFDRSGKPPTVNGKDMKEGDTIKLDNGGSAKWDGGKLTVDTGEYTIDLEVKEPNNPRGAYIDSHVNLNKGGPFSDFVAPHGLLGQTADGIAGEKNTGKDQGKQGGTVIDGTVDDYEVSDLWKHDNKFNRFGVEIGKVIENPEDGSIAKVLDKDGNVIFQAPPANQKATGKVANGGAAA